MAVVYFTSNASTGAGSLVEALQNASPGDVVRPDETVFERGATIEIALASTLTIDKNLTLDGGPFRVRLNGDGRPRCCSVASGVNVEMTSFDIVGGGWDSQTNANVGSANGAGLNVPSGSEIVLNRCGFFGCRGTYGGGLSISANSTATLNDCIIAGCYARGTCGGLRSQGNVSVYGSTIAGNVEVSPGTSADILVDGSGAGRVTLVNSIVGKYQGNVEIGDGCVVGVASSQIGFVAPPDDLTPETWEANAWQSWNFRLLDDASPTPSPYRDSGDVDAMSRYDLDGNFRGRETSGVATCSPGAYETLQAGLFWVGVDSNGATVATPSFLSADGWATSRFATASGDAAPTTGSALFVGETVAFNDAAPVAAALVVGADNVVIPGAVNAYLTIGATRAATVGGTLAALKLGDYAELTSSTSLEIPAVEFGGSNIVIDNVSVEINDGVIFAAEPRPAAITTTGSGGWADTTVGVSSLDVELINAQTVAVSIVKNDANKAAFAQYSDDDGATWRTVATTADVDKYELTVAQGADVTVRVATATGWLVETISTASLLPVWTVSNAFERVTGVVNAFEVATGGSNDGLNVYDYNDYGNW